MEGSQYQYFAEQSIALGKANKGAVKTYLAKSPTSNTLKTGSPCTWWNRSPKPDNSANFVATTNDGKPANTLEASVDAGVVPAFCI